MKILKKIKNRIKNILSLSNKGERVDINKNKIQNFEDFDIYQKSHIKRYEFAELLIDKNDIVGDFACGTGYGSVILSKNASKVVGIDIDKKVIGKIKHRYANNPKVEFLTSNVLNIDYKDYFNKIISFETIEHLEEIDIMSTLKIFFKGLKNNGKLIFSVPYMQEKSDQAIKMGFHKTFYIDEIKIRSWVKESGFKNPIFRYQNYKTHSIENTLTDKDFIICEIEK